MFQNYFPYLIIDYLATIIVCINLMIFKFIWLVNKLSYIFINLLKIELLMILINEINYPFVHLMNWVINWWSEPIWLPRSKGNIVLLSDFDNVVGFYGIAH